MQQTYLTLSHISPLLEQIKVWAASQLAIVGVALVGSYARNKAREDSDIDIVILTTTPELFLEDKKWLNNFGHNTNG
jgi:predicted nucleotidyltransferase